jgi:uncharacterized protein YabE (DUF348 family)
MIGSRFRGWFKELSTIAKIGVVSGTGIAFVMANSALAGPTNVTYKNQTVTESIHYTIEYQEDDTLLTSEPNRVIIPGKNGVKTTTYKVKYENGKATKEQTLIKEATTTQPVDQIEAKGTKEVSTVTTKEAVPFSTRTVSDPSMNKGTSKITTTGVNGEKTTTFEVVKVHEAEKSRTKVGEQITTSPVTQITSVGTKLTTPKTPCDPNYSGACVPIASDVDCGGGSGNGPAYLYGTARVIGYDIYGLDRDGDGLACE